eukprot:GHVT01004135.1.p1 GENE.GHVT01004135.1~~GHVT01004135.1.p1  ORF type:complete len:622 (+),score=120.30 GHVT01004135.1:185-1867(+)
MPPGQDSQAGLPPSPRRQVSSSRAARPLMSPPADGEHSAAVAAPAVGSLARAAHGPCVIDVAATASPPPAPRSTSFVQSPPGAAGSSSGLEDFERYDGRIILTQAEIDSFPKLYAESEEARRVDRLVEEFSRRSPAAATGGTLSRVAAWHERTVMRLSTSSLNKFQQKKKRRCPPPASTLEPAMSALPAASAESSQRADSEAEADEAAQEPLPGNGGTKPIIGRDVEPVSIYKPDGIMADAANRPKRFSARGMARSCSDAMVTWLWHAGLLFWRSFINSVRHPVTGILGFFIHAVLAVVLGFVWFQLRDGSNLNDNVFTSFYQNGMEGITGEAKDMASDFRNVCGAIFFVVTFFSFSSFASVTTFHEERVVFNRETASRMYSVSAFFVGKTLSDAVFQHIPATVFLIIFYFMVGLGSRPAQFWIFLFVGNLTVFAANSFFYLISAAVGSVQVVNIIAPILLVVFMLVAGFFVNVDDMPAAISWIQYLSFLKYGFGALSVNQFPPDETYGFFKNSLLLDMLGVVDQDLDFNIILLALLGTGERLLAFLCLVFLNRHIGLET